MRLLTVTLVTLQLLCLGIGVYAQFAASKAQEFAQDRTDLLELARIANLPPDAQLKELPHVYTDIWTRRPAVIDAGGVDLPLRQLDSKIRTMTPEAFVEAVHAQGQYATPNAVYDVSLTLLGPHAVELKSLIVAGLKSSERKDRTAALTLIDYAWGFQQKGQKEPPDPLWGWLSISKVQKKHVRLSPLQALLAPVYNLWMKDLDDHEVTLTAVRFQSPRVRDFLIQTVVTGTDFGYQEDFRRDNWMPATPANAAALKKFADWVLANAST